MSDFSPVPGVTLRPEPVKVSADISVAEAAEVWLQWVSPTVKPTSRVAYRSMLSRFLKLYGRYQLNQITLEHISEFFNFMITGWKMKPHVAKLRLERVKALFTYYVEDGTIPVNPVQFSRLPKVHSRPEEREFFDFQQFQLVLNYVTERKLYWRSACFVAYYTGLRCVDVAHLRWQPLPDNKGNYIDFENEVIVAWPEKRSQLGQKVSIPMERELYDHLLELWSKRGTGEQYLASEYAIPWFHGVYLGKRREMLKEFKDLCKRAGLPRHSFHSFRHGFVTRLLNAGVDPIIIGAMTGQSPETIRIYAHVSTEAKVNALDLARQALHKAHLTDLRSVVNKPTP